MPPPSPLSLPPDTAPASRCRAAIIAPTTANSLQRLLQRFIPTPFLRRGVRRVSISFAPKPPLAIPARKDRHLHSVLRSAHCRHPTPPSRPLWTDERTVIRPWHSLHLSPRAGMLSASIIFPSRNVSVAMAFNRSFRQSLASPTSPTPSITVHGSCLPVNSDRFGSRVERLSPPSPFSLPPDTAPASRCRVAAITPTSINSL